MRGESMHPLGDLLQSLRPVVNCVHRSHDREQDLRGADVARRLVAADVLLARLQRKPQTGPPLRIVRDADQPSGHVALEIILHSEERGVGPTITERYAETLRG